MANRLAAWVSATRRSGRDLKRGGCDVKHAQIISAEAKIGGIAYRHRDLAISPAIRRVAHELRVIPLSVPDAPLGIDGRSVRRSCSPAVSAMTLRKRGRSSGGSHRRRCGWHVGEVHDTTVGRETDAVRTADVFDDGLDPTLGRKRYSALVTAGSSPSRIPPQTKLPKRSQRPSFNRVAGRSDSMSTTGLQFSLSGSKKPNPLASPTT